MQAQERLLAAKIPDAAVDARLLLEYVTGLSAAVCLAKDGEDLPPETQQAYTEAVDKRTQRIPLQHITGEQDFYGRTFRVSPAVLVPRQDTEVLVERALAFARDGMRILDLCTGSGCILISMLLERPGLAGVGTDISEDALAVAKENAARLGAEAELRQGDLFDALRAGEMFDIIVSNPPYISPAEIATLSPEVKDHDPRMALDGGEDGLDFYRRIAQEAGVYLAPGGRMFLEIGCDQWNDVKAILEDAGWKDVCLKKDLAGLDRVVEAGK